MPAAPLPYNSRMHQILHIFRKDLRHFWPEAVACVVCAAAFLAIYPVMWAADAPGITILARNFNLQGLAGVVTGLVPVSWFVLLVRLFQDENPVGHRSYWYTKPYDWPKLLTAKALFVGLSIILPFTAAQAGLLVRAGFAPRHLLAAMAVNLLYNTLGIILPFICIAVMTPTFFKATLWTLAASVALVGIALTATEGFSPISIPYSDQVSPILVFAVCSAVIVAQYARRTLWFSCALLLMLGVTLAVLAINPLETTLLERVYYPRQSAAKAIPVTLRYGAATDRRPTINTPTDEQPTLKLPLEIADVPYGYAVLPDDVQMRITDAAGTTWTSPWHSIHDRVYRPETDLGDLVLNINRDVLKRVRTHPVTLDISLALTLLEAGDATRLKVPTDASFKVPGVGVCALEEHPNSSTQLHCRYAYSEGQRFTVTAFMTTEPCPVDQTAPQTSFPETAPFGSLDPDLSQFGLTSVWDTTLPFAFHGEMDSAMSNVPRAHLCPGSFLTVTPYRVVRRGRYDLHIADLTIPR